MRTGAGASCGSCVELATQVLTEARAGRELPLPMFQQAA